MPTTSDGRPFRPATVIPSLPLEITDHIIDLVASQRVKKLRGNLATCSLVCRAWTARSRLHFFSDCRLLLHYRNTAAFGKLLRSPYCTILPHVRLLTMENDGACIFDSIKEELKLLVRIESLKLSGSSWAVHGTAPRRGFMASLATVVELDIACGNLGDFDHTLLVICAFPALRRLSLSHIPMPVRFWEGNDSIFEPYPHIRRPHGLGLMSIFFALRHFHLCRSLPLQQFHIALAQLDGLMPADPSAARVAFRDESAEYPTTGAVLSQCQIRKSPHSMLRSPSPGRETSPLHKYPWRGASRPLSWRACSSSLTTTNSFIIYTGATWTISSPTFDFPQLKSVRFLRDPEGVNSAVEFADFCTLVRRAFPRIDARGLLQIQLRPRFLSQLDLVDTLEDLDALTYISELIPG
ncbi:hypothetical protein FB451DRAFT_1250406 [Mycena latifolia]|nr:hypothetical protein FB451DRAFT_1250406 [Mycena latifolia]